MEDRELVEGRLLRFAFRGGVLGEAWEHLAPDYFAELANKLPIGIALWGPTGAVLFENRRFIDGALHPNEPLSDHEERLHAMVDRDLAPLTPETCPVCLCHSTGRPALRKVGTRIFSWSIKWRWIRIEPLHSGGGLAAVTVDAGRSFLWAGAPARQTAEAVATAALAASLLLRSSVFRLIS